MKIYKQETDKSCGVACLRSAMNYFGNNYSEKDVWDKHTSFQPKKGGILNPIISLGVTALKFGFDVTYTGYNPIIVNNNVYPNNLKKSLESKSKNYFDYGKFILDNSLKFLELGGKIVRDGLSIQKIKEIINKYNFVIVNIKPAFINDKASIDMNHKVLVVGYNNRGFKILNPSDAKEYLWDFDSFLLAFYAAVPELLIIKKPKTSK